MVFVVCVTANDDNNNNKVQTIADDYISSQRGLKKKNGGKPRGKTSKNDKRGKKSKAKSKKAAKNNNIFNKDDTPQPNNTPSPPPPSSSSEDNTIAPTPVNTQTVGTNKTLAPTLGVVQPFNTPQPTSIEDDCTMDEYEKDPFFVSSSEGRDLLISDGWGISREKPFKTFEKAVNEYKRAFSERKCQIIYVMEGEYTNNRYEDGAKTSLSSVVVRLSGVSHLKILKDPEATKRPLLKFTGPGGIIQSGAPISYIEIAGLEIVGPNADITYDMAMDDRYNTVANNGLRSNYFRGRGIAIWNGHNINIHHMTVHHCPNSGIRVNRGDYINITDSKVYANTWWSSSKSCFII